MALSKQLKKLDLAIKQQRSKARIWIVQGMQDNLVSPKNPSYASENWQNHFASIDVRELEDEGHFLPWRQAPLIKQLLLNTKS